MRNLRIKDINAGNTLCKTEIIHFLQSECVEPDLYNDYPLIVKFGNKNFRVADFKVIGGKPVLVVRR